MSMEFKTASSTTSTSSDLSLLAVDEVNIVPYKIPSNHFAELDTDGKLVNSQIPDSIVGGVIYKGTWNAATNTPAITTGSATSSNKGYYYKTSIAGSTTVDGISTWAVGDWIISNGTTWDRIITTEASYSTFIGATSGSAGTSGLVPAPNAGTQTYPLLASGSFGVVSTAAGGTGATTAEAARSNLGAAASGTNVDITSLSGITITGYTKLGTNAPAIKSKKITGTCAGTSGTSAVAHGLTLSKIVGMMGLVNTSNNTLIPHQYNNDTFRWDFYVDSSDVVVRTGNAASGVSGRPFTILFIYEE
jgi:hypothetical protein